MLLLQTTNIRARVVGRFSVSHYWIAVCFPAVANAVLRNSERRRTRVLSSEVSFGQCAPTDANHLVHTPQSHTEACSNTVSVPMRERTTYMYDHMHVCKCVCRALGLTSWVSSLSSCHVSSDVRRSGSSGGVWLSYRTKPGLASTAQRNTRSSLRKHHNVHNKLLCNFMPIRHQQSYCLGVFHISAIRRRWKLGK